MKDIDYKRAVSMTDATKACFWAVNDSHPFQPLLLRLDEGSTFVEPGEIIIVDPETAEFDVLNEREFAERWVEERFCDRSPRALETLRRMPRTYDAWIKSWNGPAAEVNQ